MHRAQAAESNRQAVGDRGADGFAPRSTPLTLVSGAIAGEDLAELTAVLATALGGAVGIAIPTLGDPVVSPAGALDSEALGALAARAAVVVAGGALDAGGDGDAVPIRIGERIVGVLSAGTPPGGGVNAAERRAWLEAGAAAASVAALIRQADDGSRTAGAEELLRALTAGPWRDLRSALATARRFGAELSSGATVLAARAAPAPSAGREPLQSGGATVAALAPGRGRLAAELEPGRVLALVSPEAAPGLDELAEALRAKGFSVACSTARRDPADLHEALHEAEVLLELEAGAEPGADDTYRLLIGVLLRDRGKLEQLRDRTIAALADYDTRHDTELLATLEAFLTHDGSTTETAEALALHRHTVGYRLSRVQEVSGLSPYESAGRERLSLGLKAAEILRAADRRARPS